MRRLPIVAFIAVVVAAIGSQFFPQPTAARSTTHWFPPEYQLGALANYPQYALCDPASGNCASISSSGQIATTGGGGGGGSSTVYNGTGSQTLVPSSYLGDGGTYNATAQTFTSGQYSPFQTDVNGYLDVDVKTGGGGGSGSTPIPFATNAQGQLVVANASPYPTPLANQPVTITGPGASSGNPLYVSSTGGGGGSSTYPYGVASAAPTANSFVGISGYDGTNVRPVSIDPTTGAVLTKSAASVNGTYGAPNTTVTASATSVQYEQGTGPNGTFNVNLGATPQPVSGTVSLGAGAATIGSIANTAFGISGSLPAGSNAIGSVTVSNTVATSTVYPYSLATGGQTGTATSGIGVLGQYNATALTLTTGQVAPLQLDANGYLAVDVKVGGGGSSSYPFSTVPFPSATQTPAPNTAVGISCPVATPTSAPTGGVIPITCSATNGGINLAPATLGAPYSLVTQGQTAQAGSGLGAIGVYNSTSPTLTTGQAAPLQLNAAGALQVNQVNAVQPYGATSGQTQLTQSFVGIAGYGTGSVVNAAQVDSAGVLRTTTCTAGSSTCASVTSGALQSVASAVTGLGATRYATTTVTTNAVNAICTVACTAYDLSAINTTAAICYIQEFNTASGSVTLGTTAPVRIVLVPATGYAADSLPPTIGAKFSTAWSYATTTTPTGSTACGSSVYVQADYV